MAMAAIFGTSALMAASSESKFFGDATEVAAAPSRTSQRRLNRSLGISALSSRLKSGRAVAGAPLARGLRVHAQAAEVARAAKVREIFMPVLSSTMTEGKIVDWYKSEGDEVKKGDIVVVVESDKADMDVESFYDGYLAHIAVGKDEVAPVGAAIGILAETKEDIPKIKAQHASSAPAQASAPVDVAGTSPSVDLVVPASTPPPPPPTPVSVPALEPGRRIISSPYAKKLAKDLKVDLATVVGSGPGGRITADDVEAAAGKVSSAPAAPVAPAVPAVATTVLGTTTPFTGMQEAVSRNMVQSLTVPTFRVGYTISTDALDALYKKIKSKGVTMSALLAKATALAVAQHPVMNASCKDGKSFSYHSNINIAVAVAIDGGLITPVLQDADKVDIYALSRKWKELVDKARAKQLQPNEYSTGTFTLSNLGMFGVDRFDAILPPGTGAIMAVGASTPSVVATPDGLFGVKNQMQVNVTADHRIIYGADLAAFLQTLAKIIENPRELTL